MTEDAFRPLIQTQTDLERLWRRLMSPLGFADHSLWLVVIEDDRPVPQLMRISAVTDLPGDDDVRVLAGVLEALAAPGLRFAFLTSRPGGGRPDPHDLAWARTLHRAGGRSGACVEVVHLAHDHDVLPIVLDDLLAEPA
jgi:hypothetical protein